MDLAPSAFIILPLVMIVAWRRKWAFWLALVSIPFYGLRLFHAIGHPFTFPELAIIALGASQLLYWGRTRRITVPTTPPVFLLLGFLGVGAVSVGYAYLNPADVLVRPYGSRGAYGVMQPYQWTTAAITQFVLRAFSVGAIVLLVLTLGRDRIPTAVRTLVYGAVFVGVVGLIYQITLLAGWTGFASFLQWLGVERVSIDPPMTGPLPRMYSFPSEPGYVSHYILTALALVGTFWLIPEKNEIFEDQEAGILSVVLLAMLGISTGTTGYGGFLIYVAVLAVGAAILPLISLRRTVAAGGVGLIAAIAGFLIINALVPVDLVSLLAFQMTKLTFSAGSGVIRIQYIQHSFEIVAARPLLGVGVGGWYGLSLAGTLLGETGVLGFAAFLLAYCSLFWGLWRLARRPFGGPASVQATAFLVAGVAMLATTLIAKNVTALRFPWLWALTAIPISLVWRTDVGVPNAHQVDAPLTEYDESN